LSAAAGPPDELLALDPELDPEPDPEPEADADPGPAEAPSSPLQPARSAAKTLRGA
jgi:hypothetical protein